MCWCLLIAPSVSEGAKLKKETLKNWDEYIQASSFQIQDRLRPDGHFLWVDEVPERNRQVRAGNIVVSPVGQHVPKSVDSGLIHDWIGAVFIPNAKLEDVLAVARDYDSYRTFYKPNVIDSKSLGTDGPADKFSVFLLSREGGATLALDSEYEACYLQLAQKQWYGVAYTTRVQEIHDYGRPGEQKLPPDEGNGYIWRVYNLARFEERDGGVYIEQEVIALSRDIPTALRWLVDPIIRRVSKNTLLTSLRQTEEAVHSRAGLASPPMTRQAVTGATCNAAGPSEARSVARSSTAGEQMADRR
jgi:hypothetical protein